MRVSPITFVPYTGGFNIRHQKPEAIMGVGDNGTLSGVTLEDGEVPSSLLMVHKRSNVMDVWA